MEDKLIQEMKRRGLSTVPDNEMLMGEQELEDLILENIEPCRIECC